MHEEADMSSAQTELAVRVHYPLRSGRIALRTDGDWQTDLEPNALDGERGRFEFRVPLEGAFRYLKAVHVEDGRLRWAQGHDLLAMSDRADGLDVYPHFDEDATCHECDEHHVPSRFVDRGLSVRVWLPPGYDENVLESFPVLYMQDGQNLFFPAEAFSGEHWKVAETLKVLDAMSLVNRTIVVGVRSAERERDYTAPGYDAYARFLADELVPWVDAHYRTLRGPEHTGVLGSSLGGVVSLHAAWSRPDVFGMAGALSATFGWRDDLAERVANGPKRPVRIYLDSGWPRDNYETTRAMFHLLRRAGYREGEDLLYLAFPDARHEERAWAARLHVPFQWFFRTDR